MPTSTALDTPQRHHLDRRAARLAADDTGDDEDLLSTRETADILAVSEPWLEIGRSRGYGPPFVRLSPRRVRYQRGALREWLRARVHQRTSEYADPDAPRQGRQKGSRVVEGKVIAPRTED